MRQCADDFKAITCAVKTPRTRYLFDKFIMLEVLNSLFEYFVLAERVLANPIFIKIPPPPLWCTGGLYKNSLNFRKIP